MPMTFQDFVASRENQQRYWARAHLGWSRMGDAEPNDGHRALARLEALGRVSFLITQNVDGLHERAGHQQLVALHGRISEVVCLDCGGDDQPRRDAASSSRWPTPAGSRSTAPSRPGPTATWSSRRPAGSSYPRARECGGRLKPHVVFFGENVPKDRVAALLRRASTRPTRCSSSGSSLTVMSGLRFVRYAAKAGLPVVIVNRGVTRGDDLATVKVEAGCSEWLTRWSDTCLEKRATDSVTLRPA